MKLFDTHCHIDFSAFDDDREQMFQRAQAAGVSHFMVPGVAANSWSALIEKNQQWRQQSINSFFALGLHPYFIEQHQDVHVEQLQQQVKALINDNNPGFKAIGEIGLDATCDDWQRQLELLVEQLKLARDCRLPVILHHRKSLDKSLKLVRQHGPERGVVHAFSGSYEQAKAWVDEGYFLGVGGTITYSRAEKTRNAIQRIPLSAIVLETDSPDMPVSGHQGQRNEPQRLSEVLSHLAELKKQSEESIAEQCFGNSCQLFAI